MGKLDNEKLFKIIEQQESTLVFQQSNLDTACELGNIAVSNAKQKELSGCRR